jgi:hypothetical protein
VRADRLVSGCDDTKLDGVCLSSRVSLDNAYNGAGSGYKFKNFLSSRSHIKKL